MMADKIKTSYKFSKSFYDDAITQGKWWSKLYFKLLWGGVDDNEIARRVEKYRKMKQADITCLDYSQDMLEQAEYKFRGAGISNIHTMQGDVGALPFEEGTFDTANDVRQRLEPYYDILDFHVEGAMLYFRARKRARKN